MTRRVRHDVRVPKRLRWQKKLALALAGTAIFVLAVMGRRAGKTHIGTDIGVRTTLQTRLEVPWVAPTYPISQRGLQKFEDLWTPILARPILKSPPQQGHLVGGGKITWNSADRPPLSILGGGYPLVILDEAARLKWDVVQEEILPTIADTGGKILALTTPRGRRNWVHQWYLKAREGNPLYACVHGPSTANPSPHIKRFIESCRSEMDDVLFRQEILAEFVEGEGSVFRGILDRANARWMNPLKGHAYAIGCDVAKHQDYTVLTAIDCSNGHVVGMDRFNKLSWPIIEDRIAAFSKKWNNGEVWIDSTGVGDPVFDHLDQAGLPVMPTKFTNESKAHLVQALSAAMDRKEVAFPREDVIIGELEAFEYEQLPSGKFRYGAPEGYHDDIVISMGLAILAKNQRVTGGVI